MIMERQIGEIFSLDGKRFNVTRGTCIECGFVLEVCFLDPILSIVGKCSYKNRDDGKDVCFKLIE